MMGKILVVFRSRCRFARRIPNFQNAFELVLANKNLKVANLPLIPQAHIPKQLWEIDPKNRGTNE